MTCVLRLIRRKSVSLYDKVLKVKRRSNRLFCSKCIVLSFKVLHPTKRNALNGGTMYYERSI